MSHVKYPRTFHLPFSPGCTSDDKRLITDAIFYGKEVLITEKMDGENTSMYCDKVHARSLESRPHPSRDWMKQFHASIAWRLSPGDIICGENLFAKHSISYSDLPSYFLGFSAWIENRCLSVDDTFTVFEDLGIYHVPILYRGKYDSVLVENLARNLDTEKSEGFVVRVTDSFTRSNFSTSVAKWVRPNHVQTDEHWMDADIVQNSLRIIK